MKCVLFQLQYAGKSETPFNLHLNNSRSDIIHKNAIPTCSYFPQSKHRFNKRIKFALIERMANQLTKRSYTETLKKKLVL